MSDEDWGLSSTEDRRGAKFSDDREYRYRLWRAWDFNKPAIAFIMLNPSTADEVELDPTCRRCREYAKRWGYGRLEVGNIFALRSSEPEDLYDHQAPIGPKNDEYLKKICDEVSMVVVAWGSHGSLDNRGREVYEMLDVTLYALDTIKSGHPVHPLYQPANIEPQLFEFDGDEYG